MNAQIWLNIIVQTCTIRIFKNRGLRLCILRACLRDSNVHSGLWTIGLIQWWFFPLLVSWKALNHFDSCEGKEARGRQQQVALPCEQPGPQTWQAERHCRAQPAQPWRPCPTASSGKHFSLYLQRGLAAPA